MARSGAIGHVVHIHTYMSVAILGQVWLQRLGCKLACEVLGAGPGILIHTCAWGIASIWNLCRLQRMLGPSGRCRSTSARSLLASTTVFGSRWAATLMLSMMGRAATRKKMMPRISAAWPTRWVPSMARVPIFRWGGWAGQQKRQEWEGVDVADAAGLFFLSLFPMASDGRRGRPDRPKLLQKLPRWRHPCLPRLSGRPDSFPGAPPRLLGCSRWLPRRPMTAPRRLQNGPRWPRDVSIRSRMAPRSSRGGSKTPPNEYGAKTAPRCPTTA